jgi:CDP-diacylglycerol--serine O-phosphatidyltransferase
MFQPFEPEEQKDRRRLAVPQVPVRMVLPNLVTLLALCAGLTAIRMAVEMRFELAILLVAVAAGLDGIDGRMARFLKSTSRFGAELDSITDFVNFGVAPAMLVYVWSLDDLHSLGWIAALIYVICAALRLARFNVALDEASRPHWHGEFFVGVPAPAGAMVVMLPLYLEFTGVPHQYLIAPGVLVYTIIVGLLMVSQLPTWSGKLIGTRIARELVTPLFVAGVLVVAFLVSFPWETLTGLTVAYFLSLPLAWRSFRRRATGEKGA